MNFFMNLFRSTSPAWKQIKAKSLIIKKVAREKKQIKTSKTDNQHALSDALITILRGNDYTFNKISSVLNILKIKPKVAKVYTCHVARMQYNRITGILDDNSKTFIN